jgi:hypothetical protein
MKKIISISLFAIIFGAVVVGQTKEKPPAER